MDVREALLQRILRRILRMRTALEQFDNESAEREGVGLHWNVRDLVGHFIHWGDEGSKQAPHLASGGKKTEYDLDRVNDEIYRKYKQVSFAMLLPQLREAEERFLAAVRAVDPKLLVGETAVRTWIDDVGIEHYDKHWPGLDEAARRLGPV